MYCKKCGNKLNEKSVFCPMCGEKVNNKEEVINKDKNFKIIGIKLLYLLFTPVGLILIWWKSIFKKKTRIVLSILSIPLMLIQFVIFVCIIVPSDSPGVQERLKPRNERRTVDEIEAEEKNKENLSSNNQENIKEEQSNSKNEVENIEEIAPANEETINKYLNVSEANLDSISESEVGQQFSYLGIISGIYFENNEVIYNVEKEVGNVDTQIVKLKYNGDVLYNEGDYVYILFTLDKYHTYTPNSGLFSWQYYDGTINEIHSGDFIFKVINTNFAIKKINANYEAVYLEDSNDLKGFSLFKVYDKDNKCYLKDYLASDDSKTSWYKTSNNELGDVIYTRDYQ